MSPKLSHNPYSTNFAKHVIRLTTKARCTHFSKLLTMTGRGRDMVRAPLMAVKVPTNLPSPETGKMSPYLEIN